MRVLAVNSGSSSLKLRVVDDDVVIGSLDLGADAATSRPDIETALLELPPADAVAHRIVHGGERFTGAVVLDADVVAALHELQILAPLHQPRALAAVATCTAVLAELPAVACFDTAFHSTLSPAASTYAVPRQWREQYGARKYGFHGLSHAYVAQRVATLLDGPQPLRIVSCHLGAGASVTAIRDGKSVDTTMGFTPIDGLVMATRSGSVDPGLLLWLQQQHGLLAGDIEHALLHDSGVLALAGTSDMRAVVDGAARDDGHCRLALDVYTHRLRGTIAAMAAAVGGLDALVFTGGVGENSSAVRAETSAPLGFLGVVLDPVLNVQAEGEREIGGQDAPVRTFVIAAREELHMAAETTALLSEPAGF